MNPPKFSRFDFLRRAPEAEESSSFSPTQIFEDGTTEEKGENARLSAFVGAIAVGDLVKSTLGPKGMDKILQSASTGEIMVTNDGATILKSIALDNAAAKVLVNISKVQDDEVGDGTTSVAVLAAELLREAEKLVDKKIHPQTIIEGYRIASQAALKALNESAVDRSNNPEAFRKDLRAIARTTLSSKVLAQDRDHFSKLATDAVLRLKNSSDLSHIQIIKKAGGKLSDSYLDEGFILDKKIGVNQPKRLEKAKILVANTSMDTDKIKIFGARVKVGSTSKLADLEKAEKEKMKAKVDKIKAHGINCFINRQLIYNWPEQLFTDAGIMSIEHADFDGIERLALVTGGEIASTFDHPDQVKLGSCDVIEEVIIGEDTLIKFSGVAAGEACTIVLRGATDQLLDEAERSLHDALAVLSQTVKEPWTTLGGGCAEMVMAKAVEGAATRVEGKKQMAVSSFAIALRQLPTILADNAGLDSGELVARLRKAIYDGMTNYGLDLLTPGGGIADMRDLGVVESYKLKRAVVSSASEAAETFLPAFIALYTAASPAAIKLQQTIGDYGRSRRCCFSVTYICYLFLAVVWASAARTTLALSTQSAGAICPVGFLGWERQIPLAQIVTVALDALLIVHLSRWRQDTAEDAPQAWAFASRLFLGSAGVLAIFACFSFHNMRNIRWAFLLHGVAVRDLLADSTVAAIAISSGFYVMADLHPSTLAMITTASGVYAHQLVRMLQTAALADDSLVYMISGGVTIAGVGLLLRYDKDISGSSGSSTDHRLMRFLAGWYVVLVGFLCGTYLVFYPDFASTDTLSFPDLLSVENAKSDAWMAQANESRSLNQAVENYRNRYGIPPPPNFDKWYEYAVANGSPIIDDFTQINDDLLPFWGVPPEVLRQRTTHVLEFPQLGMGGLRIRGGKVDVTPGTPGSHRWMMESMQEMVKPFAEFLPDMDFAMNLNDEPRTAVPFEDMQELERNALDSRARLLSNEDTKAFDNSKQFWSNNDTIHGPEDTSPYFSNHIRDEIYYDFIAPTCPPDSAARNTRWWSRRESCRDCLLLHAVRVYETPLENQPVVSNWTAATDLCHQPDLAYLHGFLLSPAVAIFTKMPFPVFSQSKTSGFADILIPSPWNFDDKAQYDEEKDMEYENKKNVMFWRGSATDGYAARGSWQSFLRARFVQAANSVWETSAPQREVARSDDGPSFDVGFVGNWQKCHQADCEAEKDTFWAGRDEPDKNKIGFQEHWQYAHLMDLDGAGFSGRFIPFLRSRSLVYRSGVFRTWLAERVHAWRHYVPVDVRLGELRGLFWFFGADYEGRIRAGEIAGEGREWAGKALRREDMRIYMFRLLLEWGRLVDDSREELGFKA
ncbi:hypothetical protein CkaCkLH20_11938 [Colletotrichum karsti]|uniref:CCT-beta n=1 Tax=Colletotrichum karsti TaxID=1095194 RepID=A0A9P6LFR3_9PEZI|nr:uncharacterized protein CkaCkLH20_11938 [Colletotrichum karsti]KAF9870632.1 hypothetical protein CkaCkLH20_11938 [Colletotrichum karsti]